MAFNFQVNNSCHILQSGQTFFLTKSNKHLVVEMEST